MLPGRLVASLLRRLGRKENPSKCATVLLALVRLLRPAGRAGLLAFLKSEISGHLSNSQLYCASYFTQLASPKFYSGVVYDVDDLLWVAVATTSNEKPMGLTDWEVGCATRGSCVYFVSNPTRQGTFQVRLALWRPFLF
jgi:hypothetical protein